MFRRTDFSLISSWFAGDNVGCAQRVGAVAPMHRCLSRKAALGRFRAEAILNEWRKTFQSRACLVSIARRSVSVLAVRVSDLLHGTALYVSSSFRCHFYLSGIGAEIAVSIDIQDQKSGV